MTVCSPITTDLERKLGLCSLKPSGSAKYVTLLDECVSMMMSCCTACSWGRDVGLECPSFRATVGTMVYGPLSHHSDIRYLLLQ
jgi:hypothetical protein